MNGDAGLLGTVTQGDDGHDGLEGGDVEEGAEVIGLSHSHDKGVEAHGAGLEHEVSVAETVVIGTPEVSGGVYRRAAEEAGLAGLEGGDNENGSVNNTFLVAADKLQNGITLFFAHGYVVLAGLLIGPGRSVLCGEKKLTDLILGDGFAGLVGTDTATGGKNLIQGGDAGAAAGTTGHEEGCQKATEREDAFHIYLILVRRR